MQAKNATNTYETPDVVWAVAPQLERLPEIGIPIPYFDAVERGFVVHSRPLRLFAREVEAAQHNRS